MEDINNTKIPTCNMIKYITNNLQVGENFKTKSFRRKWFDSARNLYQKNLSAHHGCVNAVEFSPNGDLLFSGGDDRKVLLWKLDSALIRESKNVTAKLTMRASHYSNIFCLAVDSNNNRVLSGSNDDQVIIHDYNTGSPVDYFVNEGPVFSISLRPANSHTFASASDNGQVLLFDSRDSASVMCIAQFRPPFHGVMFHPLETEMVATANATLGVHLWDIRKPKQFLTHCCDDQGMAVRWNAKGSLLLCLRNLLPPLLIDPADPSNSIEFDDETYYNACTMKSCCFAGDDDQYILSGSDDFNVYMWKIPDPWPESKWVDSAHLVLRGHRSIVNQVRYCSSREILVTSGVEKMIKVWSPYWLPGCEGGRDVATTERPRLLCSADSCKRSVSLLFEDAIADSLEEDQRMIHFFDSLLRNEFSDDILSPRAIPVRHQLIVKRKKQLLSRTLKESRPQMCSVTEKQRAKFPRRGLRSLLFSSRVSPSGSSSPGLIPIAYIPHLSVTDSSGEERSIADDDVIIRTLFRRNYRFDTRRRPESQASDSD